MNEELRNPLDDLGNESNAPEGTTSTEGQISEGEASVPIEQAGPEEAELILGKFKTVEDLGKSYEQLERAYHGDRQAVAAFQRFASQWHIDGKAISAENLLEHAHKAMLELYTKSKPAETPVEDEVYVDPDVKKFLEPHLSKIQLLENELSNLRKSEADRREYEQANRYADAEKSVQEEAKRIMTHPDFKHLKLTEEKAYRLMNLASPGKTGEDEAREILKIVQEGTDKYIESKKTGGSQKRETGGASPLIEEKETRFRPGKDQITPLKAWETSNI